MRVALTGTYLDGAQPPAELLALTLSPQSIDMAEGESVAIELEVLDTAREAVDLTGWTLVVAARRRPDDAEPLFAVAGTLAEDPATGLASFVVPATATTGKGGTTYLYDLWGTDPDGLRHRLVPASHWFVAAAAYHLTDTVTPAPP
jgi:hypothetical protein